ncbi:MAG: hypothetical protein HS117_17485 [Verrucomicrobiaceae bacterium]|nr:hypothetical protein [Verrucomicrobiaceae bacterium]
MTPFTITSFQWRKEIAESLKKAGEEFQDDSEIIQRLSALARFLEANSLSTRKLTDSRGQVNESFCLKSDDLTEAGLSLIRKAYKKWQTRARSPDDVSLLQKALDK